MKYYHHQTDEKGFILLATMIILILLSIIGLSMYQQAISSTQSIGTSRLKSLAQAVSLDTLSYIEKDIIIASDSSLPADICAGVECDPPTVATIDKLINGNSVVGFRSKSSSVSGASIYYLIQNLGPSASYSGLNYYRTTIVTNVMGAADVIESVYGALIP